MIKSLGKIMSVTVGGNILENVDKIQNASVSESGLFASIFTPSYQSKTCHLWSYLLTLSFCCVRGFSQF